MDAASKEAQNPAYSLLRPVFSAARTGPLGYPGEVSRTFVPLQPGEPVGVIALSGPVDPARLALGVDWLRERGHPVMCASNLASRGPEGYLAGGDDARLAGLDDVLDRGARVLLAARGGYGSTRLLARMPWPRLVAADVVVVGYSDVTAVLSGMLAAGGGVQLHGPMVAADLLRGRNAGHLWRLLTAGPGGPSLFSVPPAAVVRPGRASGTAVGGNLAVLCSLVGTPNEPLWDGAVVFLEDVGEPIYRLDRMLTHLAASARFRNVKALIGGSLRGCGKPCERGRWRELMREAAPPDAPVVTGLPFGHGADNRAFPVGAEVEIDTRAGHILWRS